MPCKKCILNQTHQIIQENLCYNILLIHMSLQRMEWNKTSCILSGTKSYIIKNIYYIKTNLKLKKIVY